MKTCSIYKYLSLIPLLFLIKTTKAQNSDYLLVKDSLFNLCFANDSASLNIQLEKIKTIDSSKITINKSFYYRDYGFIYYKLYAIKSDSTFLKQAIDFFEIGYKFDTNNALLLNDLIVALFLSKQYNTTCQYIASFKKLKSIDSSLKKELKQIEKKCQCKK